MPIKSIANAKCPMVLDSVRTAYTDTAQHLPLYPNGSVLFEIQVDGVENFWAYLFSLYY